MSQLSFATLDHRNKKKQTKREQFLGQMERVVPWPLLLGLIEPYYPKITYGFFRKIGFRRRLPTRS